MFKLAAFAAVAATASAYVNEVLDEPYPGYVYEPLVTGPVPIFTEDTPTSYDIRNIDGVSYASPNLNQHIPQYCGSCWAHGTTSALADRFRLALGANSPPVYPAIQVLLNCGMAGSCGGGTPSAVYSYIARHGIPTSTCQQYKADDEECSDFNTCRNCDHNGTCWAVDNYPTFEIDEHGTVFGEENIMAEIAARGPVACGIDATPIEDYTGGIFEGKFFLTNHVISIGGYGTGKNDAGEDVDYWIVRNSWGEYWGSEDPATADPQGIDGFGWARISRDSYKPMSCNWATPKL